MGSFDRLLARLTTDFPDVRFKAAERFRWEPETTTVFYASSDDKHALWSLLHEVGHASLKHKGYRSDLSLLIMESEAWNAAKTLAKKYGIYIEEEYIQDCVDSYREWLHKRSRCPACLQNGVEQTKGSYRCINCPAKWDVSTSRFCRVYRKSKVPATEAGT